MKRVFTFLFFFVFILFLPAQNTFHKNFSKLGGADYHKTIIVHDSGFVLSGWIQQTQENLIIRTDANGDTLWTRLYSYVCVNDLVETYDHGFFITGISWDTIAATYYILALKIDSVGNSQWAKRFSNTYVGYPNVNFTCQTVDSGLVVVAQTYVGSFRTTVVKMDKSGNYLWKQCFYQTDNCRPIGVIAMPSGGVVVLAKYYGNAFRYSALLRIDNFGNLLWAKEIHSGNYEDPSCFYRKNNGNFIIAGQAVNQTDFLIETDSTCTAIWMKMYSWINVPVSCIAELPGGGYVMGTGEGNSSYLVNSPIIKIDSSGNFTSAIVYYDIPINSIFLVNNGYTIGTSAPYGNNDFVMHLLHVDSTGFGTCNYPAQGSLSMQAAIAYTQPISLTVTTGGTYSSFIVPINSGCTIDSNCISFLNAVISTSENKSTCKIIPQPFHENVTLEFSTTLHNATISIYDIRGKIIFSQENISGKEIHLENSQLNNGLFFYRVTENENVIVSGKLLAE